MTEWRPIPEYPMYEVSELGIVRSLDRLDSLGRRIKGRELKQHPTGPAKYLTVTLFHKPKSKSMKVHLAVLEAFVGPRPAGHDGLHGDDDRANNRVSNLRWGTKSENSYDAVKNGVHPMSSKTHCPQGHPYDLENTVISKQGWRRCLICKREGYKK